LCSRLDLDGLTPEPGLIEGVTSAVPIPLKVTVHKVIDLTKDPVQALEDLIALGGINSILSSGGAENALKGSIKLREMVLRAGDKIKVIVAGKVSPENLEVLHRLTGATEYHGRKIVSM